ncbi:MAG: hypothetical protein NXI04_02605 [Planctomycetaceae bacterium]|nr:hypothetical protein [Planctomycetaceae bacterium]
MSVPTSSFGFLTPASRRLRARRRSVFVAELLDARRLLSAASSELAAVPAVSADTPAEPASALVLSRSDLSGDYETAEHSYPADDLMNSMMSDLMTDMMAEMTRDTSDEMPVMMMTDNMLLSPAVTAPEFRGQLFDAVDAEAANILRVDPDADAQDSTVVRPARTVDVTVSPVTRSEAAEVSVEPAVEAEQHEADSGVIPEIELLPTPDELPESRRDAEETSPDARSAAEDQADEKNDGQRLLPSEPTSAADTVPAVSLVQPTPSLAARITGLELPSLDELFSHGYQLAIEGPTPSLVSVENESPVDE